MPRLLYFTFRTDVTTGSRSGDCSVFPCCLLCTVGPKKKSKAQKEAERLQAEEEERKAEILRVKREAERVRKEAEDAKRRKEEQVCVGWAYGLCMFVRICSLCSLDWNVFGSAHPIPTLDAYGVVLRVAPLMNFRRGFSSTNMRVMYL